MAKGATVNTVAVLALASLIAIFVLGLAAALVVKSRNMQYWLPAYLTRAFRAKPAQPTGDTHVYFCFADHYEPYGYAATASVASERVRRWEVEYPRVAASHYDSDGRSPVHSFFYPAEEYEASLLDRIGTLCSAGHGDVEVHLHHDNDTAENLDKTLREFVERLHKRHGFLRRNPDTQAIEYCFIHGNWALDNSRPDGRWCGVNNELEVLERTGCRCDMTMPSAPSDTQTAIINSIYFAKGRDGQCKSHDTGRHARVGEWKRDGEILMIQGPLALNWHSRKFGLVPRIESAEISADAPPTAQRVALWARCAVTVEGAPDHVFIKVHTHGAVEETMDMLFGSGFETLWSALEAQFRDAPGYRLHYVTAWEMYQRVEALCATPAVCDGKPS
jgi:hypothetical protein